MIHENRIYAVISMIALILVVVYYLISVGEYGSNYESVLYMQNNSEYPLQSTTSLSPLKVFDATTLTHNILVGRVYFDAYETHSRTGRYILTFSTPPSGGANFAAFDDRGIQVGTMERSGAGGYRPVYVNFNASNSAKYIDLQYNSRGQNIIMTKISIEFF